MKKIPTLFVRDPHDMSRVTREVTPGCEWVLACEGVATRKYDGTNILVEVRGHPPRCYAVNKRRNPTREERAAGAEPGYVLAHAGAPEDQHIIAAVNATDFSAWPVGDWPCEALGPKIQGGREGGAPRLVPFSLPSFVADEEIDGAPLNFDAMALWFAIVPMEGIVWHHPDGRMAKIKSRDFGIRWPKP